MDGAARLIDGAEEAFPYRLFDSPYLQAEWDSGRIFVTGFDGTKCYDFTKPAIE